MAHRERNADAAKRLCTVFTRAQKFMTEAPKADRDAFVSKFSSVRPELVAEMSLPNFVSDFNVQSPKTNMELAVGPELMLASTKMSPAFVPDGSIESTTVVVRNQLFY